MFCPKCGIKNPNDGKFCRKCGTDLSPITAALTGKSVEFKGKNKNKKLSWESAMSKLFVGLAFLAIAIILGVTNAAGGNNWWFWMLIPAFAMIGSGVAQILQIKQITAEKQGSHFSSDEQQLSGKQQNALPPNQTDYVSPSVDTPFQTGDLVPGSVVENTTRHLELEKEGETRTLPQDKI